MDNSYTNSYTSVYAENAAFDTEECSDFTYIVTSTVLSLTLPCAMMLVTERD